VDTKAADGSLQALLTDEADWYATPFDGDPTLMAQRLICSRKRLLGSQSESPLLRGFGGACSRSWMKRNRGQRIDVRDNYCRTVSGPTVTSPNTFLHETGEAGYP
jgi:hypothetical protein